MPKSALGARSINQDRLAALRDAGADSDLLDARLALVEDEGMRKDLAKLKGHSRVYPELLPTQASLRWSTKNPNLPGFQREFWTEHHGVIQPDPGEWWLSWDWSGIEARMFTAYTGDSEDVLWFTGNYDIHTETCQHYLFEWDCLPMDWRGKADERRVRAKNFRYGVLQYGSDERAILGMPGIETLGLDRPTLVRRARRFLEARPQAQAWKARVWQACIDQKEARTFMGHRRMLFGDPDTRKKEGLNHMIQGSVANLMAWCLIEILVKRWPRASLILNAHDGATLAFPLHESEAGTAGPQPSDWGAVRTIVEREWTIGQGTPPMRFPAEWKVREGSKPDFACNGAAGSPPSVGSRCIESAGPHTGTTGQRATTSSQFIMPHASRSRMRCLPAQNVAESVKPPQGGPVRQSGMEL